MTVAQRNLIKYWLFGTIDILTGIYIYFSNIEDKGLALLALSFIFLIVSSFQDFSHYIGYGEKGVRLGAFVEKHPLLKVYLIIYCVTVVPLIIYKIGATEVHQSTATDILYFSSFIFLIGPVVIVSESERYKRYGE